MRMELAHPSDTSVTAVLGWDHLLGFWVEIRSSGHRLYQYDNLVLDDGETTLRGLLHLLITQGFFSSLDIAEAHKQLGYVDDVDDIEERNVRMAAEVIERLKEAASR